MNGGDSLEKGVVRFGMAWLMMVLAAAAAASASRHQAAAEPSSPLKATTETPMRTFYQVGNAEEDLPVCHPWAACARVDVYGVPWAERMCRCPGNQECSLSTNPKDNKSLRDGPTKLVKTCRSVSKLPTCRLFSDTTWTVIASPSRPTETRVHCRCPQDSLPYLLRHSPAPGGGQRFRFACSPSKVQSRCHRKEPCRLFTVQKRVDVEEARAYDVCSCPRGFQCAERHTGTGVVATIPKSSDPIKGDLREYSAYCTSQN